MSAPLPGPGAPPGTTPGRGLLALRPGLYALLVALALPVALGYRLRTDGVFACPPGEAGRDDYLSYCNAVGYGDYDRGAFWFGLEPRVRERARDADVLFLGNSRMEFGFSSRTLDAWFAAAGARHYLLGFSHTEDLVFTRPLLADLKPRARAYVINVDRFFDDRETRPTQAFLHDKDVLERYREKRLWQSLHGPLCRAVPLLCGDQRSFRRSRENGAWELRGTGPQKPAPVADGPASASASGAQLDHYVALARAFVAGLPVERRCLILTITPSDGTLIQEARAIAAALELPLVVPQSEGLVTFDGSHLDPPSAERFSAAFLQAAGEQLRGCLGPGRAP